ncbi:MAG TPA: hypothetical protein VFV19_02715 [Candidatus Polarisedimenticolaceae bacterium]|nr:hypothetical protein [Candidatus Polarisedimenticolaceae bacterium]
MIVKIEDIKPLLTRGRVDPEAVLPELIKLASSDQRQTREVAATGLVELGKRHPAVVLREARRWAKKMTPMSGVPREGLRGIVKVDPQSVGPVLEDLRADPQLYVKKSVANVLRNASTKHPDFALSLSSLGALQESSHSVDRQGWASKGQTDAPARSGGHLGVNRRPLGLRLLTARAARRRRGRWYRSGDSNPDWLF